MVDKGFAGLYKDGDLWSGGFLKRVEMAKRGRRVEGKKVDMLGYLQRKVGDYCDRRREEGEDVSIYEIYKGLDKEWWNLAAVLYGSWLRGASSLKTEELSDQEW